MILKTVKFIYLKFTYLNLPLFLPISSSKMKLNDVRWFHEIFSRQYSNRKREIWTFVKGCVIWQCEVPLKKGFEKKFRKFQFQNKPKVIFILLFFSYFSVPLSYLFCLPFTFFSLFHTFPTSFFYSFCLPLTFFVSPSNIFSPLIFFLGIPF